MMTFRRLIAIHLFGVGAVFFASCGGGSFSRQEAPIELGLGPSDVIGVQARWAEPLVSGGLGENVVELLFSYKDASVPSFIEITGFHPRMPYMGNHGTDESSQYFEHSFNSSAYHVRVSGIFFNMPGGPGEWVVTAEFKADNGRNYLIKLDVPLVE